MVDTAENEQLMLTADDAWNRRTATRVQRPARERSIVSNPTGAVSGLLGNPTDAVSGVLDTVSQAGPTGVLGNVVNTVTSALGSSAGSASAQITSGSSQANAQANTNVPAPPPVSLPALPELPAVGALTSTASKTLNSVTGT
jgi:hypothetical protein